MNIVSELVVGHVILGTYEVNVSYVIKMSGWLGPVHPLLDLASWHDTDIQPQCTPRKGVLMRRLRDNC